MTCAKTTVRCTLVTPSGEHIIGTNLCRNPQATCPRAPGEDYTKCTTVCDQVGHAEFVALAAAGPKAKGARAFLEGHTYACMSCQHALFGAGVVSLKPAAPLPASPAADRAVSELAMELRSALNVASDEARTFTSNLLVVPLSEAIRAIDALARSTDAPSEPVARLVTEAWAAIREARGWLDAGNVMNALVALRSVKDDAGRLYPGGVWSDGRVMTVDGATTPPAAATSGDILQKLRFILRVLGNFAEAPVSDRADAHQMVRELIETEWKAGRAAATVIQHEDGEVSVSLPAEQRRVANVVRSQPAVAVKLKPAEIERIVADSGADVAAMTPKDWQGMRRVVRAVELALGRQAAATSTPCASGEALRESVKNIEIFARGALEWLDKSSDVLMKRDDNSPAGYQMSAYQRIQFIQAEVKKMSAALAATQAPAAAPAQTIDQRWYINTPACPDEFREYVAKNYSGEVVFHDPGWHAERLWRAACYAAQAPADPATSQRQRRLDASMAKFDTLGPLPGMIAAFESHYGQKWTDADWRNEASVWAAAWALASRTPIAGNTEDARNLDSAVALATGKPAGAYATQWQVGGPLLDEFGIDLRHHDDGTVDAFVRFDSYRKAHATGGDSLEAAMRALVKCFAIPPRSQAASTGGAAS